MQATEKTKRKNDTPRSRRLVIGLAALLILIFGVGVALLVMFVPSDPTGHLYYSFSFDPTSPAVNVYDFDTGQRESADPAFLPKTKLWNTSPDGKWYFYWQETEDTTEERIAGEWDNRQELIIGNATTGELRSLGLFYRQWVVWSSDSRWITLTAYPEADQPNTRLTHIDLWRINPETGEVKRLTDIDISEYPFELSPDGQSMAYITDSDGRAHVYMIDIAAGITRQLITIGDVYVESFSWSSDSQWLAVKAFASDPSSTQGDRALQLLLLNPRTGEVQPLSLDGDIQTYQWSPDSHWIALTITNPPSLSSQSTKLSLLNTDTQETLPITERDRIESVQWSPDGTQIAFISYPVSKDDEKTIPVGPISITDLTGTVRLLTPDTVSQEFFWSPDSQWITYTIYESDKVPREQYGAGTLSIANPDTGRVRTLFADKVAYDPAWSPDSQWIAFAIYDEQPPVYWWPYNNETATSIWLIRPDGRDAQVFTSSPKFILRSLYWQH
jgi:Tol biopolymer transport system component